MALPIVVGIQSTLSSSNPRHVSQIRERATVVSTSTREPDSKAMKYVDTYVVVVVVYLYSLQLSRSAAWEIEWPPR